MLRSLTRILLVMAFLAAQSAGIAHQLWHDAGTLTAHANADGGDSKAPKKNPLCDFHTALGSILGAIQGSHAASEPIASSQSVFLAADIRAASSSLLASRSRGPPTLL